MSTIILNIDTALEEATVSISENGKLLHQISNPNQKDHASFLHPAIKKILDTNGYAASNINAIAVTLGPGSYTGLRVGLAAAKGLCYAWGKPLIGIGTLQVLAASVREYAEGIAQAVICPMIDARRMEVFTALMNMEGQYTVEPCAMILNENSFDDLLNQHPIIFTGNGAPKFQDITKHRNAHFYQHNNLTSSLAALSLQNWQQQSFIDIHLSEPLYVKEHESMAGIKKS